LIRIFSESGTFTGKEVVVTATIAINDFGLA